MAGGDFTKAFMGGFGQGLPGAAISAFTLPFNLLEAGRQREFQKSAIEAQLGASTFATQQSGANQLMSLFSQAGENTASRVASLAWGADLDFGRQLTAEKAKRDVFAPKDIGLAYDKAKRFQSLGISPEAKEFNFENYLNEKRSEGSKAAFSPLALTFGQTAFTRPFT